MDRAIHNRPMDALRAAYPEKFLPADVIFRHIHPGGRIFIGTTCGLPQYLVSTLIQYVKPIQMRFLMQRCSMYGGLGHPFCTGTIQT